MANEAKTARAIVLDLYERRPARAIVIALEVDLLFAMVSEQWKSIVAATSAGIAHADYEDPTVPERERALAALQKIRLGRFGDSGAPHVIFARPDEHIEGSADVLYVTTPTFPPMTAPVVIHYG